jgi:signal transduction histidine kinase/CheY-like chemotaxis protein
VRRPRVRLSLKLALLVVLAVMLTAATGCLAAIVIGRSVLKTEALAEADERVEMYARAIEFYLDHARAVLETTANFPVIRGFAIDHELARPVLDKATVFEYVVLLRGNGDVHLLEPPVLERQLSHRNLAFHPWFRDVVQTGATVVSDLHISPATQRPSVVIATPVFSPAGQLIGVWAGALRLEALSRLGRSSPTPANGFGYVTDRRGLIIAHQSRASYVEYQTDFSAVPAVRRALDGQRGALEFVCPISDVPALGAHRPLERHRWAVVYMVPTSRALEAVGPMARGIALAAALLAVGMGTVGFLLAQRIVGPLQRLTRAAQTIAGGGTGEPLRIRTGDEIEELAGALDRMATSLQDVISAERRARVEVEEQSRRVQEANRLKSEFLANMSHELRTPLNGIIGFAELMHDGRVGVVSAEHREYLGDILVSGRHLLRLINDVLDLAKVESGALEFRPEAVDVGRLASEVRGVLREVANRKRIGMDIDVDASLDPVVLDAAKLKQVLYNYVANAVKFTPPEGRVTIRLAAEGEDRLRIEVEDTGIGIAPEDIDRLFVEFQQLDSGLGKRQQGTGLGLALTRRIVEAQGGQVGVRSTPGAGSVFFAVLPRLAEPAETLAPAPARMPLPGAPVVLVIEDQAPDRAWLVRVLTEAGYAVEVAASGGHAVTRAGERAFDAITLDLLLPDMTAAEVMERIRNGGRNRDTPVIVVTVVAEREAAAGLAIHDFLTKPVPARTLLASLARVSLPPADRPILILDDDVPTLRLAAAALGDRGYRVLSETSGVTGLRMAESSAPAAVVLDLLMPGLDGFEFLERYRATEVGRGVPVIVWTAKDLTARDRARLDGAVARVVSKREAGTGPLLAALDDVLPRV